MSTSEESAYHPEVARLFTQLTHAGSLAGESNAVSGQAGTQAQGFSVRLWLRPGKQGTVAAAYFEAYACPHLLAAVESLCRWLEGRTRIELSSWSWRQAERELAIPPTKRTHLLTLQDALQRAGAALSDPLSV